MAAENAAAGAGGDRPRPRFNEAAAHGRGKPIHVGGGVDGGTASMRPRRMAAENTSAATSRPASTCRFNEAAAHGRGKRYFSSAWSRQ